jgi:hypothetical protein
MRGGPGGSWTVLDPRIAPVRAVLTDRCARWHAQIVAWHRSRVTNGPTEAMNNLVKRIERIESEEPPPSRHRNLLTRAGMLRCSLEPKRARRGQSRLTLPPELRHHI